MKNWALELDEAFLKRWQPYEPAQLATKTGQTRAWLTCWEEGLLFAPTFRWLGTL